MSMCESTVVRPHYHPIMVAMAGVTSMPAAITQVATVLMKYVYSDGPSIILISRN